MLVISPTCYNYIVAILMGSYLADIITGNLKRNHQSTKLKLPPNISVIWYGTSQCSVSGLDCPKV